MKYGIYIIIIFGLSSILLLQYILFTAHAVCPPSLHIPKRCRTCCCISSRNVEFVDPSDPSTNRRCRARGPAKYKVSLKSTLSSTCHPNFALRNSAHFSGLALHSHMPIYRFFDRCQRDHVQGTIDNFESSVSYLKSEYERSKSNGHIYDYYFDSRTVLSKRKNRRVGYISVSPNASTVTLTSKLVRLHIHMYMLHLYIYIYMYEIMLT